MSVKRCLQCNSWTYATLCDDCRAGILTGKPDAAAVATPVAKEAAKAESKAPDAAKDHGGSSFSSGALLLVSVGMVTMGLPVLLSIFGVGGSASGIPWEDQLAKVAGVLSGPVAALCFSVIAAGAGIWVMFGRGSYGGIPAPAFYSSGKKPEIIPAAKRETDSSSTVYPSSILPDYDVVSVALASEQADVYAQCAAGLQEVISACDSVSSSSGDCSSDCSSSCDTSSSSCDTGSSCGGDIQ